MVPRLRAISALAFVVCLAGLVSPAHAQRRGAPRSPAPASDYRHGIDLNAGYTWMWGGSLDARYDGAFGKLRTASGGALFFAAEIPMRPGVQLQLQYTRQDGQLDWDPNGAPKQKLSDMSVNFWQIGGTAGLPRGRVMPFTTLTMGVTYFAFADPLVKNTTKFSITAGVGAKTFFGRDQKIGLRVQFRVLPSFYETFATIGTGGVGVSGSAIWQWDVGGALVIKL
jgi:hypothetical protein